MSSSARLYVVGILTAGVVVWSLADFGREAHAPTDTELSVRVPPTREDHVSDPGATDEKAGMAELDVADLRSQVALLRSDLAEVQQQLRRLARTVQSVTSQAVREAKPQQLAFEQQFRFKVGAIPPRMMLHSGEQQDGTISATIYLAREVDLPPPTY